MSTAAAYLESLNPQQRRAVEHGLSQQDCTVAGPLVKDGGQAVIGNIRPLCPEKPC